MRYGYLKINLADLWSEPRFNSERASQLFFAEPVRLLKEKNGFAHVEQCDGYTGWADLRFLGPADRSYFKQYRSESGWVVHAATTRLYRSGRPAGSEPFFLYYGTKLRGRRTGSTDIAILLPDARIQCVKRSNLRPVKAKVTRVDPAAVIADARRFLGVPYLWGGVTSAGFDCSGFVRTVMAQCGVYLPRDTKDQIKVGRKVARERIKTGDLVFFKRHVGFAVGTDRVIHSSAGGGGVRVNSLTPGGPDYRPDLDRDFNQARRLACFS